MQRLIEQIHPLKDDNVSVPSSPGVLPVAWPPPPCLYFTPPSAPPSPEGELNKEGSVWCCVCPSFQSLPDRAPVTRRNVSYEPEAWSCISW